MHSSRAVQSQIVLNDKLLEQQQRKLLASTEHVVHRQSSFEVTVVNIGMPSGHENATL